MASWPSTLPAPQKNIIIIPGDTRKERRLQSGRYEFRRIGNGKPDQAKVPFHFTWAEWDIFKGFYAHELNFGINFFSADWITSLGYATHKAKILGYPREIARQNYYVDIFCNLLIQKTDWIISEDSEWPCEPSGIEPEPLLNCGYAYGGYTQDCDKFDSSLNTWINKTDMPLPARSFLAASTINNLGYVYGGDGGSYLRDCDKYDPLDVWASRTDMPTPVRSVLAASTISNSGYVYGGTSAPNVRLQDCDEYTPDTWVSKTDMPTPGRYLLAASTIGNAGYIYGGAAVISYQDCDEYTPDTWVSKTDMPLPARRGLAASTIGSSGYVYGGHNGSVYFQDCDEYTPDTWVSKTDMLTPARTYFAASTIGSSGYIYGGHDGGSALQDCDKYRLDTWISKADMPVPARNKLAASTI